MSHRCRRCDNFLDGGYPCGRCNFEGLEESDREFAFDGGEIVDQEVLQDSAVRYLADLQSLVEDLAEQVDDTVDAGRAEFAVDHLEEARAHLVAIGDRERVDVAADRRFGPDNGGVVD